MNRKRWIGETHTIIWARVQALGGLLLAAIAAASWESLLSFVFSGGITRRELLFWAGLLFAQGLITELLRRYRATDL